MAKRKIQEPDKLVKLNETVREYGGMYANWRSSGCQGILPADLVEKMIDIHSKIESYLKDIR